LPDPREEQPQQHGDVGVGARRRARAAADPLLIDDDRRVQVFDVIHVRLAVAGQEALHEGGEGLVQLALRLGGDRVEDQRRFPGTGDPGEDRDPLLGDVDRDPLRLFSRAPCTSMNWRSVMLSPCEGGIPNQAPRS
jgi:hypothetical protein